MYQKQDIFSNKIKYKNIIIKKVLHTKKKKKSQINEKEMKIQTRK